jgi:uncharacterized protein YkwD
MRTMLKSPCLSAAAALCTTLLLITLITAPADAVTRPEHKMLRLVNGDRRAHGLPLLRLSSAISRMARRHSRQMAGQHRFFDSPCLACILRIQGWSWIGENVGYAPTVRRMNRWFMHSPPHRANILSRHFTRVGIGILRSGGSVWVTEIFFRP